MTTEEVKTWLRSYRYLKSEAERLEEELAYWRSKAEKMTRELSGMPSGSGGGDKVPACVEKIWELERDLSAKLAGMVEQRQEIERAIEALPDKQKQLMRYRYIDGMKWEKVAVEMNMEYRWVLRIHGRALQEICKLTIESHC
ncbi:MAG: sigma factor-like helix-turn-helix DNA-binding protein [Negativibacillus sp.]